MGARRRVEFQKELSLAIVVHHLVLPSEVQLTQMFMSKSKITITWQSLMYIKFNSAMLIFGKYSYF